MARPPARMRSPGAILRSGRTIGPVRGPGEAHRAEWVAQGASMINGAHVIVYSNDAEADRAFLRDVLGLPHVDVGGGWLIFGMPPSEVAVHPGSEDRHELYLMCENVAKFVAAMKTRRIACTAVRDEGWGKLTEMTLPGGGTIGVYE